MCYPENPTQNPAAKNASEDVYDLLIFELERDEIENAFRIANINFNHAFLQGPMDPILTLELEQQIEFE